jgi:hypothetical protein
LLSDNFCLLADYFLNLFRPITARLTKPEPSSISVAGSGTAEGLSPVEGPSAEETSVEGEVMLDLVVSLSDEFSGQPTIPKNIIATHKTKNNFFIFFPSIIKMQIFIQNLQFSHFYGISQLQFL